MPDLYFASENAIRLLEQLPSGFLVEFDDEELPVLLMKFDSGILTHIIKGVPISLLINNPKLTKKTFSLLIYDNAKEPFWNDGMRVERYDERFPEFDTLAIKLAGHQAIQLVLYNDLTIPIYTTHLPLDHRQPDWHTWMGKIYNDPSFSGVTAGQPTGRGFWKYEQSFEIKIANRDHGKDEKIKIIYNQTEGDNADKVRLYNYDFNDYMNFSDGKHGINQELSIKHMLSNYFTIDKDLFIAPNNEDGTEFTDFVILLDDGYILIESKFIISSRSGNINNALKKATMQLQRADDQVRNGDISLEDRSLEQELVQRRFNLKLCLHNDDILLNESKVLKMSEGMTKQQLPMFVSVMVFGQFLAALYIKNPEYFKDNIEANLVRAFTDYYTNDKHILILRNFRAFGQSDDFFDL